LFAHIFVLLPAFSFHFVTYFCTVCPGALTDRIISYIRYLYIVQFPNHEQSCSFACELSSTFPLARLCSPIHIWIALPLLSLV